MLRRRRIVRLTGDGQSANGAAIPNLRLRRREVNSRWLGAEQWDRVMAARISVFVTGPAGVTHAFIDRLSPRLVAPVVHVACDKGAAVRGLNLASTVILHDVDTLALADQRSVLKWLETVSGRIQVISTSSRPVLPLVESRGFLGTLYYRLNAVYFALPAARPDRTPLRAQ